MQQISKFQGKFDTNDLNLLRKYAKNKRFLVETGTGISTHYIAKGINQPDAVFYTIDINPTPKELRVASGVSYLKGWTTRYEDFLKPDDPRFVKSQYRFIDSKVVFGTEAEAKSIMSGEIDLVRKVLAKHPNMPIDFYFSDSGEYCGYPEWLIVKDHIAPGGIFAAHDIYYPKSAKNCKVVEEIENSPDWTVLEKTTTKQGMLIAMKTPKGFAPMDDFKPTLFMFNGIRKNSTKREPATVQWARNLGDGVLYDIGANVGAYSLIAAKSNPGLIVHAFEPLFANYYALVHNIIANFLSHRITAFSFAIAEKDGFEKFNCASVSAGSALSALGDPIDYKGEPFEPEFVQHVFAFSVDSLVTQFDHPAPTFVKLDVDSIETQIVRGMRDTLRGSVRSILIEGDKRQYRAFDPLIRDAGFALTQVENHPKTNNYIYWKEKTCPTQLCFSS